MCRPNLIRVAFLAAAGFVVPLALQAQRPSVNDTAKVTIKRLAAPFNSSFNDFAPVISADGRTMLFTSNRPATARDKEKGRPSMENVYQVEYDEQKRKWGAPVLLGPNVNAAGRNNSAIAISPDGQRMLVYRDDAEGNGDIYESELNGSEWSELNRLPEPVNSGEHESSACYAPDGRTIYFVSDRKGGPGGKDIWRVARGADGTWGEAAPLEATINTRHDEQGLFLSTDGRTLYFSSKGHGGSGGYDLFRSRWTGNGWGTPQDLNAPLNTEEDDLYLVLKADGRHGYFASMRTGGMGQKDIYEVRFVPKAGRRADDPQLTVLKGQVIDEETKEPVGAGIDIVDNTSGQSIGQQRSNSSTGNFLLPLPAGKDYGINVRATGYLFHSENIHMSDTAGYKEIAIIIELKRLKAGKTIVLKNVFYDFDKATLQSASYLELDKLVELLNENPEMRIELGSHTDAKGADDYNQRLSDARAASVVTYLTSKGIASDRLVAKGYGESGPVATNDTDEGRQLNRRTEFKVLE